MNKNFAERLNKALDNIEVPARFDERISALVKLIKIPRFKAEAYLSGTSIPDAKTLALLARELEVKETWLLGKDAL